MLVGSTIWLSSAGQLFSFQTARLTLEEIAKNFGEEVAVHVTDATDEEKAQLERDLAAKSDSSEPAGSVKGVETGNKSATEGAHEAPRIE
ncbi:unnamed protein product [Aspergillus oryzae]|nr:unnamed protein product [Aspergillus oryzae]GMF90934.1 unnamed protein product [Aspergillus oryzae]